MSSLDKEPEYSLSEQNSHESLSNSILPLLIYSVKGAHDSLLLFSEALLTPAVTVNISFFFQSREMLGTKSCLTDLERLSLLCAL